MNSENIVSFHPGETPPLTVKPNREYCAGRCRRVFVVEKTRTLQCRDCKRIIEPFDYLMQRAQECDRRIYDLSGLDAEIRMRRAERDDLKREVDNLKAQRRRLNQARP